VDEFDLDGALQAALSRLTLISDVGTALFSATGAETALERAGRVLARDLGDWCVLDLCDGEGGLDRTTVVGRGEGPGVRRERVVPGGDGPMARVLAGAGPLVLSAEQIARAEHDPACAMLSRLGASGAVMAPLRARREVFGAVTVARAGRERGFGAEDATLADEVVGRIALAVDNARLHDAAARIAERLQRSLLPPLPEPDRLELAARYQPAQRAAEVGGDWYDTFVLPDGEIALIIGDVSGHDLMAAVTMSQVRNMLRGIACDRQEPPGLILRRLDLASHTLYPETLVTCSYALVKAGETGWELRHSSAGHPPLLLVTRDGDTRYLDEGRGPLLGVLPERQRSSSTEVLPIGSTVLFYTDGLVERRGESMDRGLTRLRQHAAALARRPVDQFCDELLAGMAGKNDDDIALLAVRVAAPAGAAARSGG
jgi:serine phosphatase RsbU (regulator of sigma subunit)